MPPPQYKTAEERRKEAEELKKKEEERKQREAEEKAAAEAQAAASAALEAEMQKQLEEEEKKRAAIAAKEIDFEALSAEQQKLLLADINDIVTNEAQVREAMVSTEDKKRRTDAEDEARFRILAEKKHLENVALRKRYGEEDELLAPVIKFAKSAPKTAAAAVQDIAGNVDDKDCLAIAQTLDQIGAVMIPPFAAQAKLLAILCRKAATVINNRNATIFLVHRCCGLAPAIVALGRMFEDSVVNRLGKDLIITLNECLALIHRLVPSSEEPGMLFDRFTEWMTDCRCAWLNPQSRFEELHERIDRVAADKDMKKLCEKEIAEGLPAALPPDKLRIVMRNELREMSKQMYQTRAVVLEERKAAEEAAKEASTNKAAGGGGAAAAPAAPEDKPAAAAKKPHPKLLEEYENQVLSDKITDVGVECVVEFKGLASLEASHCRRLTDDGIAWLTKMVTLTKLNLYACETITDAAMAHVAKLPRLSELRLYRCSKIGDAGIAHLTGLKVLRKLDVGCTGVTDNGLEHISQLRTLSSLDLSGCTEITDNGLRTHITKLRLLSLLGVYQCPNITDASKRKFPRACQIIPPVGHYSPRSEASSDPPPPPPGAATAAADGAAATSNPTDASSADPSAAPVAVAAPSS